LKQSLLIFLSMLLSTAAVTQNAVIFGKVKDAQTDEPLPGVVITNEGRSGTVTDEDGAYQIVLTPGEQTITFRMTSYKTITEYIHLSPGEKKELNALLESDVQNLGIVVVSAGKYEQNLSEVTVSMEVIQPRLLQDKNIVELSEGLQQTPGVSIVDDEPQIRSGSGYSFGAGSRVQVLVDDIPVLSGDAGKPSWGFLPLENVSQVEVIKGASSVLYGSSALSGVINFRTAYPTAEPRTRLTTYHGVYSDPPSAGSKYWDGKAMKSGLFFLHSQSFGLTDLVIGASLQGDDGHLGPIRKRSSLGESFDYARVDRYNASDRARITINLRRRSEKINGLSYGVNGIFSGSESLATLIWENDSAGLYGAYKGSATRTIQQLYTIDPFITLHRGNARHSLKTRWQSLDNNNDNNQGNFSDVYYGEYQYQQNWDSIGIRHLTSTLGVVRISTDAVGELFTGGDASGRNRANNTAMYLQLDKRFGTKWNASAGVRYEQFELNGEREGRPVFRTGLNYHAARATWLRASFGQGYRFPSIAEKFIVTSLGAIKIFASPDLRSETSWNAEIGAKQGFRIGNFKGFADVALFRQEFTNFIEFTFGQWDPNPGITNQFGLGFKSINTGRARVSGVDFSVMGEGQIGPIGLQLLAGYTYTKPISLTPDQVYGRAPASADNPFAIDQFAQASYSSTSSDASGNILKYRLQHLVRADLGANWKGWNAGISFRSNSHMQNIDRAFADLEEQLPGAFNPGIRRWRNSHTKGDFVWDTRIGYQINSLHKVGLVINNLLNREYAIRPLAIEETRLIQLQYVLTPGKKQ
jgi:outer membrane receptor protein involved in Fe transport